MQIEKEALGIVVRNYRVSANHAGTVVLVPLSTEGEEKQAFVARGMLSVETDLSSIRALRCGWLGEVVIENQEPTRIEAGSLPRFLRKGIPPELEVYVFDLPSLEPAGNSAMLFVALSRQGLHNGAIAAVGFWDENSRAPMAGELGGYIVLSHLAEELDRISPHRDTIQSPRRDEEE